MATLADLWRTLFPAARPVGRIDDAAANLEIGWVRVLKARVPAFDALDPNDLAIIPATALATVAPSVPEIEALVDELVRVRVGGLVLLEGELPGWAGAEPGESAAVRPVVTTLDGEGSLGGPEAIRAVEALGRAAAASGLPAYRYRGVNPVRLERSVIGFLVNRRAEVEREAARLEAQLEQLALQGRDLETLVAAIGSFLGRAVAVEGRRGDTLAVHAPAELPGAAAAAAAYLSRPRSMAFRVSLPAAPGPSVRGWETGPEPGRGGEPGTGGSLVILGDTPVTELERVACERIAALLALELGRDAAVRRARDIARRSESLPPAGPPWVVMVARQGSVEDAGELELQEELEQREAIRSELRLLAPARRLALRGDAESVELRMVAAVESDDPLGHSLAGRIAGFLRRTIAVSRPFEDPAGRPAAEHDARITLEAAVGSGEPPPVARADRLAAYRLLGALHNLPDGQRQAHALLDPILNGRPAVAHERLATLRAVLDHVGPAEAAAALGVHRNTIAYRIRLIERLTGWDLQDPSLRLALSAAVRIVQTEQIGGRDSTS